MNNDLFINSTHVLTRNWKTIFTILAFVGWGSLLTFAILKKITGVQFSDLELITLALGGWPLPVLILSTLLSILHLLIPSEFVLITALAIVLVSLWFTIRVLQKHLSPKLIIPIIVFLAFVFVRLGYSANLVLPPYFDSAEHYRIIQSFIDVENPLAGKPYYHLGYHIIGAALTLVAQASIGQITLLFGQIILATIPLPIYFFVRRATSSDAAAWFGVILATFGWFMPAHAVNWGKYPALLSLLLIQFTLGITLIKNRWLLVLSLAASVLVHSRSIILLAIFGLAWIISAIPRNKRILILILVCAILGISILLIERDQVTGLVFAPYGIWVTLLIGLLTASVFQTFSRLTFASLLSILLMLGAMFIPVTSTLTLLDRPFVEMTLFLPLAFLGGLGATRLPKIVIPILVIIIIIHAWRTYDLGPSKCCQLASRDDIVALDWMDKYLPADARVAIASADLSLGALGGSMRGTGSDAGIWVTPLTGREMVALPYSTDFSIQETHDRLCEQRAMYIYVGGLDRSFNPNFADANPAWYKTFFILPKARIVQTLGCN